MSYHTSISASAPAVVPRTRRIGDIDIYEDGSGGLHLLVRYADGRRAYAGSIDDPVVAADSVHALLAGDDPAGWDGDEPQLWADAEEWWRPDSQMNCIPLAALRRIAAGEIPVGGGDAAQEFADELRRLSAAA